MSFGKMLKKLIEAKQCTQKDIAVGCNIQQGSISDYVNDKRLPTAEHVTKISNFFRISEERLLEKQAKPILIPQVRQEPSFNSDELLTNIRKIIKEELSQGIEADELAVAISKLSAQNQAIIKTMIMALGKD